MKDKRGFTLVEVIATITILGVITMISLPIISSIQSQFRNTKYDKYKDSLESAAKLYIDSKSKDEFGNQNSGCVDVPYQKLLDQKLIDEIDIVDTTCNNAETFVRVKKSNDTYDFTSKVVCTKGETEVYRSDTTDGLVCDGTIDEEGPEITFHEDGNMTLKKTHSTTIRISDPFGYAANLEIKYYWIDASENIVAGSEKKKEFKNPEQTSASPKLEVTVPSPSNLNGLYRLRVEPIFVSDSLSNKTTEIATSQAFNFDNMGPTITAFTITSRKSGFNSRETNVKVAAVDPAGVQQVCYSTTNNVSGCSWHNSESHTFTKTFSQAEGSGATNTLYAFAKDNLGNISAVKTTNYTLYKECNNESLKYTDCDGYTDIPSKPCTVSHGNGWGLKGANCKRRDKYTAKVCGTIQRACPCDSWCTNNNVPFDPANKPEYNGYWEGYGGSCKRPPCSEGVLCANNACLDISQY